MDKDKVELDEKMVRIKREVELAKKTVEDSVKVLKEKYPDYFEKEEGKDEKS